MRSIVAASDLVDVNDEGLRAAAVLAARTGAAFHVMHGVGVVGLSLREALPKLESDIQRELAEQLRDRARLAAAPHGAADPKCHVSYLDTMSALPGLASRQEADLAVLSATSLRRAGGPAPLERLLRTVSCPVLLTRPAVLPYRRVLIPVSTDDLDGGTLQETCGWLAFLYTGSHDRGLRGDIHVLHVTPGLRQWREIGARLDQGLREAEAMMCGAARLHEHVRWAAQPAERILETADQEDTDLIVMAPDRSGPATRPGRSTWESVVSRARCSVLLMPPPQQTVQARETQAWRPLDQPVLSS